tara:strand:+ start:965 stop:1399 length:435 start_codon:yes stop_codon:yes gene_type:complete
MARQTRITNVRPAGVDHQVVTVEGGRNGIYRREPCPKCPWRRDAVGEFPAEAFKHSASTAYDMAPNTFACHSSGVEKPAVCAGFLLRNSENNLGVRLMQSRGELDLSQVHDGGHELFPSYRAMAVANGVDAQDPALASCRADHE